MNTNYPIKQDMEKLLGSVQAEYNRQVSIADYFRKKCDEFRKDDEIKKLEGRKVLIRGNHDPEHIEGKLRKLFEDVKDYKEISDNGRIVCMCHFPILFYNRSYNPNRYMLCGHVHNTKENKWLEKWRSELRKQRVLDGVGNHGNIINVGCMMPYMDYTPRTLDELIEGVGWQ